VKILILAVYYNRPALLKKAMQSLVRASEFHDNWELVFGDDNSPVPGEPIVREVLGCFADRITFVNSNMSLEQKITNGLTLGRYANEFILKSNANLVITLCDDDLLHPMYLKNINDYFDKNCNVQYAYSHVSIFNPMYGDPTEDVTTCSYNRDRDPINCVGRVDSSQVAFRRQVFQEGVRYPETTKLEGCDMPWLVSPDAYVFQQLFDKYGPAPFTGFISQYKGVHDYQLVWNKRADADALKQYIEKVDGAMFK